MGRRVAAAGGPAAGPAASGGARRSVSAASRCSIRATFALLGNCQAVVIPYDDTRALDARRVYLKPNFLPVDRPYWRAREAGEL